MTSLPGKIEVKTESSCNNWFFCPNWKCCVKRQVVKRDDSDISVFSSVEEKTIVVYQHHRQKD